MHVVKKKVVLLGDGAVGKTSLIRRFVMNKFDEKYITTIGTRVSKKTITLENYEITLLIWDILGQKGYERVQWASFKGADGALMVADLTRRSTLESLESYWIPQLYKISPGIPIVFLGNKRDLPNWEISEDDLKTISDKYNTVYHLTSAKTGENVEQAFEEIAKYMLRKKAETEENPGLEKEIKTIKDALDFIIYDFSKHYGDMNDAMPIVRRQAEEANLDIKNPKYEEVRKFLDLLESVEKSFKGEEEARKLKMKRLEILRKVG